MDILFLTTSMENTSTELCRVVERDEGSFKTLGISGTDFDGKSGMDCWNSGGSEGP